MTPGAFHPTYDDLPVHLPLFPLQGALLLPWGLLPLNIFEPRYINMISDALGRGRMVGMIQPRKSVREPGEGPVPLYDVGCAGRITSFTEQKDGRFLITLAGVARFTVDAELPMQRGYRTVVPNWQPFAKDLDVPPPLSVDPKALMVAFSGAVKRQELPINSRSFEEMNAPDLINTLCMLAPCNVQEKQALLEAKTIQERADMLMAMLQMARYATGEADSPRQ